jgi:uncharacterized membrane protein YvbJ
LILVLFLIFRSNEALFRVLSQVGWSIQVLDVDVKDAVHAVGVEASRKKISTVTRRNIDTTVGPGMPGGVEVSDVPGGAAVVGG